ncbi:hypothetical protein [Plebeiibacterium marinum]|uniref:Uncharacterized protein n=1 Tax=Plebeiibacterium marinum TaxID=2992111 RepID=A0AAE3SJH6_9BACT|nr:hypothetical protein [Plebeiobacterium marinum]MCW3805479.1 hypothetical protein [Plebeiobacterium marinum]
MTIEKLQADFDKIEESDDIGTIEFVEKHFDFLISFDSSDIVEIEDVAEIFSIYYSCLGICNRWTEIISNRDKIVEFVNKLKGKREDYNELYFNIEFVYSQALLEQGNELKKTIQTLIKLNKLKPKDEDIILSLRRAKYALRSKTYKVLIIISFVIIFCSLLLRLIIDLKDFKIYTEILWIILVGVLLTQYVDNYKSNKSPAANKYT